MPKRISCPSCSKGIQVPDNFSGHGAKCPGCGAPLPLTADDFFETAVAAATPRTPPRVEPAERRAADASEMIGHHQGIANKHLDDIRRSAKRIAFWITFWSVVWIVGAAAWMVLALVGMNS